MPYLPPSSSQTTATIPEQESEYTRPSHRRTRSATPTFSTESGLGAFTPLVSLPRRQRQFEKRTLFQIAPDDDEDAESASSASAARPQKQTPKLEPPTQPHIQVSPPPVTSGIPFPSSSGALVELSLPFPSLDPPTTPGSRASSISRSGSTPILLASGKTLKPSLKSPVSSSQSTDWRAQLPRSRSEPSTPLITKTVHFPDNLENVVLFEKTARPRAVSGNADDTETETEGYDSPANATILAGHNAEQFGLEIDVEQSSTVPVIDPTVFSNVHVETIVFPRTRPPTLRGSILVKNVAFEKSVALRFTLDNWQTTSEVVCRHVCTLPSLPSPFPPEKISLGSPQLTWDRFSFMVRLEDVELRLAERTIFFAARFMAAGVGEWWDNNLGANYKLIFKKAPSSAAPVPAKNPSPLRLTDAPKKMFPGLDLRPSTMSLPPTESDMPLRRLPANDIPEEQLLRRNIGGLGQFQAMPIKPLAPFLTVAYILAQRILSMARASIIFSMQKVHIARQAMHLVVLFNDSLDVDQELSDEQEEERIQLEDELRGFERVIKRLDDVAHVKLDGPPPLHKSHQEFFRWRPYFENTRDVETDLIYPKLEAYDLRTLEIMQCQASNNKVATIPHGGVTDELVGTSDGFGSLRLSNYASPTSSVQVSGGNSNRNSISMMMGPGIGGHPISLGPSGTSRGDFPVRRRFPNNSFNTPSTSNSITPTPTSLGAPFTHARADRTPSPTPFTNAKANGSSYPFSTTEDSTYAALVEKWCFHQSPPSQVSPSLELSAPSLGVPNGPMNSLGVPGGFESGAAGYDSGYGSGHHKKPFGLVVKP